MSPDVRNENLKQMLCGNDVVVFPDSEHKSCDGMPSFSVIFNDLKTMYEEQTNAVLQERKQHKKESIRKPRVDMGPSMNNMKDEDKQFASNFDPELIKGNI